MRASAVSWRRSRARNGRPFRPSTTTSPAASTSAHATSSGPPLRARTDGCPAAGHKRRQPGRRWGRANGHHRTGGLQVDDHRPIGLEVGEAAPGQGVEQRTHARRGRPARRPSPGRPGGDRPRRPAPCARPRRRRRPPATPRRRAGPRGTRSGSSTISSSMARPPPRSRMSIPARSPRTAPMRLATAPRAPGRSGTHTRRMKEGTS